MFNYSWAKINDIFIRYSYFANSAALIRSLRRSGSLYLSLSLDQLERIIAIHLISIDINTGIYIHLHVDFPC